MANAPFGFFDPRNPLFSGGYPPMGRAPAPLPTPAADAARATAHAAMPAPGYPQQTLANPGIYAPQSRAAIPPGIYRPGESPQRAAQGAAFGLGGPVAGGMTPLPGSALGGAPGSPVDPQAAMQLELMRGGGGAPGRGTGALTTSAAAKPPPAPRAPGGGGGAPAAEPWLGPSHHEPATPDTAAAPAVPADAMAAGDPDKQDFLDMQRAITEWQMGMGGTGMELDEANKKHQYAQDIGAGARIKGNSIVNNLTRALGGAGEGYFAGQAKAERAKVKETVDQLRNRARSQLDEVRERRRGKKPAAAAAETSTAASSEDEDYRDYFT